MKLSSLSERRGNNALHLYATSSKHSPPPPWGQNDNLPGLRSNLLGQNLAGLRTGDGRNRPGAEGLHGMRYPKGGRETANEDGEAAGKAVWVGGS